MNYDFEIFGIPGAGKTTVCGECSALGLLGLDEGPTQAMLLLSWINTSRRHIYDYVIPMVFSKTGLLDLPLVHLYAHPETAIERCHERGRDGWSFPQCQKANREAERIMRHFSKSGRPVFQIRSDTKSAEEIADEVDSKVL